MQTALVIRDTHAFVAHRATIFAACYFDRPKSVEASLTEIVCCVPRSSVVIRSRSSLPIPDGLLISVSLKRYNSSI
jgi:hypothetical protein